MLIVEDDASTRGALERIFARRGWLVVGAATLAEAERLLDEPPDALILDLMLPDGDGESLLRRIRDAGLPIRVVVTTGTCDRDRLNQVESLRPDLLLVKPVTFQALDAFLKSE